MNRGVNTGRFGPITLDSEGVVGRLGEFTRFGASAVRDAPFLVID